MIAARSAPFGNKDAPKKEPIIHVTGSVGIKAGAFSWLHRARYITFGEREPSGAAKPEFQGTNRVPLRYAHMNNVNPAPAIVLVVEDLALPRMTLVDRFEDDGFEVLEASNVTDALAWLSKRPDISVLISDVTLPGPVSGYDLAKMARLTHPKLLIMMASGRPPRFSELPTGGKFRAKPYNVEAMIHDVREMIDIASAEAFLVASVTFTVMKLGGLWCIKVIDRLGMRFIGAFATRGPIEALASKMFEEALAAGEQPHIHYQTA